jgi:hypothetical protein
MDAEKKQEFLNEATHWLVVTMAHDERLRAHKGTLDSYRKNEDVSALVDEGCDLGVLLNSFAFAAALPACYPPFTADQLRELAYDCRSVLRRMKTLTPSQALSFHEDDGSIDFPPTGGDMHVSPALESDIENKARCYESLAELCKEKLLPTRATLGQLSYLWPVFYVKSRTGEPNYARVARILQFVGIAKNPKQLRVGFEGALGRYGDLLRWMTAALMMLSDTDLL